MVAKEDETLKKKNDGVISSLTSFIMLRRDSSSLNPRENVRFLGEPLLSRATESMFGVFVFVKLLFREETPPCVRGECRCCAVCFLRSCVS